LGYDTLTGGSGNPEECSEILSKKKKERNLAGRPLLVEKQSVGGGKGTQKKNKARCKSSISNHEESVPRGKGRKRVSKKIPRVIGRGIPMQIKRKRGENNGGEKMR